MLPLTCFLLLFEYNLPLLGCLIDFRGQRSACCVAVWGVCVQCILRELCKLACCCSCCSCCISSFILLVTESCKSHSKERESKKNEGARERDNEGISAINCKRSVWIKRFRANMRLFVWVCLCVCAQRADWQTDLSFWGFYAALLWVVVLAVDLWDL